MALTTTTTTMELADDVDVDAEARLRNVTLGMKAQADELLVAGQVDKALQLYRELLMHLTRSHVTLLRERKLVVSCRMNVLAALSKAKQWRKVIREGEETLAVFTELQEPQVRRGHSTDEAVDRQVLARAYYFRGFAYMRLGSLTPAQLDFKRAMELNPQDEAVQSDWKELETALQAEVRVKQSLATSMKLFQAGKYQCAVQACKDALRESKLLKRTELIGLIHGNLAAIYVKWKDDAKAIEHYKRTMLLTGGGSDPTPAQNERVFDILDSLAGCYSRKRDYSSALSVIEDQIKLFPQCPERQDREAMMHLNGGRICFTTGKITQAEEHLEKGLAAAQNATNQADVELNCAYWLSKAYTKGDKFEEAMEILDTYIPRAEEETATGTRPELLGKLYVARLDLLDPEVTSVANTSLLFRGPEREAQMWSTLEFFESKRYVRGHLRAAEALMSVLRTKSSTKDHSEVLRALQVVENVEIGKLTPSEAVIFMKLALYKVEFTASGSSTGRQEAKTLLVKILRALETAGGTDPTCRLHLQHTALGKLVEICSSNEDEETNNDVRAFLEEAIRVWDNQPDQFSEFQVNFTAILPNIARWKASRGDLFGAEKVLERSVKLLRDDSETDSERLCEALIGLCVVQVRLGMVEKAASVMKEIETLPIDGQPNEICVIKDRLHAAITGTRKKKQNKVETTEHSRLLDKQRSAMGLKGLSFVCGATQGWWGRWCGVLFACVVAIGICLVCG